MQTILGSGGVIGNDLAKSLMIYTDQIRLVSRNPKAINHNDALFPADLLDPKAVQAALKGSSIAYLTAGLPYSSKIWQEKWPLLMRNVIDACKENDCKLVFFSNVYALGKVEGWMSEESPMNPCSKKGEVRAKIEQMLLDEIQNGNIQAMIARAADFYGPGAALGFVDYMVFQNLAKGKTPQILVNANTKHSYTFTPDAARATAALGNTMDAYNQIWNLPTDPNALSGKDFAELVAQAFGAKFKYTVVPKWMTRILGLFIPEMGEAVEMLYQNQYDYLFDSSKYVRHFKHAATTYREGIQETVAHLQQQKT